MLSPSAPPQRAARRKGSRLRSFANSVRAGPIHDPLDAEKLSGSGGRQLHLRQKIEEATAFDGRFFVMGGDVSNRSHDDLSRVSLRRAARIAVWLDPAILRDRRDLSILMILVGLCAGKGYLYRR